MTVLYLDVETTSGHPKKASTSPWRHCAPLGIAYAVDDDEPVYVPADEFDPRMMDEHDTWVNHGIKYDMHVLKNGYGYEFPGKIVCTTTMAKLVFSDLFDYGLELLCRYWGLPHKKTNLLANYVNRDNKDYAKVPYEIMAEYACGDIISNRALYKYLLERMYESGWPVFETECALTKILFEMEQRGVKVDPSALQSFMPAGVKTDMNVMEAMWTIKLESMLVSINKRLVDGNLWDPHELFEPHNSNHCHRLLCEGYGLPVLKYTEKGKPCFDKYVLKDYKLIVPDDIIDVIEDFRAAWTIKNLFIDKYTELVVDGELHYWFNQTVRTGRMSCSEPNMQQLNDAAKQYVVPREGKKFLSMDYAQIEFREIVHYIENPRCIHDYNQDPDTDFHQWAADMCDIPRKPAKNVNFMLGYGGGKKKTLAMLKATKELMHEGTDPTVRARQVYDTYHETLPELKTTSKRAEAVVKKRAYKDGPPENRKAKGAQDKRGYTTNMYGRRRYLPVKFAHIAFNTLCQGSAADLMKERLVALDAMLKRDWPEVELLLVVHDEVLCEMPEGMPIEPVFEACRAVLEAPTVPLRVPIRVTCNGASGRSWAGCKGGRDDTVEETPPSK